MRRLVTVLCALAVLGAAPAAGVARTSVATVHVGLTVTGDTACNLSTPQVTNPAQTGNLSQTLEAALSGCTSTASGGTPPQVTVTADPTVAATAAGGTSYVETVEF